MLKGTWGIVDSKLDTGFHCVRPTEIGNAILHCIFYSPLSNWEEKASFLQPRTSLLAPTHACLKDGLAEVRAEAGASLLPQDSYPQRQGAFSFPLASPPTPGPQRPALCPVIHCVDVLSGDSRGQSCRESPSGLQVRLACRPSFVCNSSICHVPQ